LLNIPIKRAVSSPDFGERTLFIGETYYFLNNASSSFFCKFRGFAIWMKLAPSYFHPEIPYRISLAWNF